MSPINQFKVGDYVKGISHRTGGIIRGKVVAVKQNMLDIIGTDEVLYVLTPQQFKIVEESK